MSGEPLDIRVIGFVSQTARHFALASRTSGPLARHIIYMTSLVLAAPQASCTSLSLSARARHGNTGPARASACGHMNHDYARLPVCTRTASRCPPTDPVPSIETARNARSSLVHPPDCVDDCADCTDCADGLTHANRRPEEIYAFKSPTSAREVAARKELNTC
jgi:hypothetical protein